MFSVDAAVAALARYAPDGGRVLAGGQSLLPMMALRLAQPAHLVDINTIPGLDRVRIENDGALCIPACVRHVAFERAAVPGAFGAMLATVAAHIAHHPIRTRGTFCGSIAHADPASEWCLVAVAFDARLVAVSVAGRRGLAADRFFSAAMTTALREDELLLEVRLPVPPAEMRFGFCEHSRRAGDYALAMTLCGLRIEGGVVIEARLALGGAEATPRRLPQVEALLVGATCDDALAARAAEAAAAQADVMQDAQIPAALRGDYVRATTRHAVRRAMA